jgi:hypothetical protein
MKYVMSWTDAPTFHHDLPFVPPHYTYAPFTSVPQFISIHFDSIHFTSLRCIFGWFPLHLHFALFITFLILFLKSLGLQETVPKAYVKLYLHSPHAAWSDAYGAGRKVGASTDISKVSGYSIEDLDFSPHQQIKKHPCPHRVSFPSIQSGQICTVKSVYFSDISGVTSLHTDLGATLPSSFTFMIVPPEHLTPNSAISPP